jgi:diguanylate cyclase (GGDEF)-like protein/PAS domain S-box-containing protein
MAMNRIQAGVGARGLQAEAEARLARHPGETGPARPAAELLHELQVHRIELEMQNEELRRAYAALEATRDSYADLYDFAPVGYLTLDSNGLVTKANLTAASLLGIDRAHLVGHRFARQVAPVDRDRWHRHALALGRTDTPVRIELLMGREGPGWHAQVDGLRVRVPGEKTALRITLADISARKRAESELRLAAIAFETQEGIMITDASGVIERVNHAFTAITGYSATEAVGQRPRLLHSGRHDAGFFAAMWQSLHRDGAWQGEIWNRRKDGGLYPAWLTITAVRDEDPGVVRYVGMMVDIAQRKADEAAISRLAFYDPLTGLPNRRLAKDRLHQALAASARSRQEGALMFIDLDEFKTVNDTLGHDRGDLLLQQVAQRLTSCLREGDTVARTGGDEFIVILAAELSESLQEAALQAKAVGEKILAALGHPYLLDGRGCHSSVSIGITLFSDHLCTVEELLKRADQAMYQAKAEGRNTLRFFDAAIQQDLLRRAELEAELRQALVRGEFLLHYQPIVDHESRLLGAEALLRWRHPTRGLLAPVEFIAVAESCGLIRPLSRWVLETACAQLAAWAADPARARLTLSVNISARELRDPHFVEKVLGALRDSGADPNRLRLELTESTMLDNVDDSIAKMKLLRTQGVAFALDDFGTGYSSLSYLKRLPLQQLKIDQSFVRDVLTDPRDAAIARTILALGRSLGLMVVAEGVETQAQRQTLANLGYQVFQGHLFGRPVPALADWICAPR